MDDAKCEQSKVEQIKNEIIEELQIKLENRKQEGEKLTKEAEEFFKEIQCLKQENYELNLECLSLKEELQKLRNNESKTKAMELEWEKINDQHRLQSLEMEVQECNSWKKKLEDQLTLEREQYTKTIESMKLSFTSEMLEKVAQLDDQISKNQEWTDAFHRLEEELTMEKLTKDLSHFSLHDTPSKESKGNPKARSIELENKFSHWTLNSLSTMEIELPKTPHSYKFIKGGEQFIKYYTRKDVAAIEEPPTVCPRNQGFYDNRLNVLWKDQIIHPTKRQLKEYKGDLNAMLEILGGDTPSLRERNYRKIRIPWRGRVLWTTPYQLLEAEGDLNTLEKSKNFHPSFPRKTWNGSSDCSYQL